MTSVTISPKFQIVTPAEVRRVMHLTPGQKVQVIPFGNRIELFPVRPIRDRMPTTDAHFKGLRGVRYFSK